MTDIIFADQLSLSGSFTGSFRGQDAAYRLIGIQHIFSGTTAYSASVSDVRAILVECVGGGGSGAGSIPGNAAGGGGGGGGYASKFITNCSASYTCSVGIAGTGSSQLSGQNGGVTSFGNPIVCAASGGNGGDGNGPGGFGGSGSVGDFLVIGSDGDNGIASLQLGGNGGGTVYGGGTTAIGRLYGGGGAGVGGTATPKIGANGVIRVWEYV